MLPLLLAEICGIQQHRQLQLLRLGRRAIQCENTICRTIRYDFGCLIIKIDDIFWVYESAAQPRLKAAAM